MNQCGYLYCRGGHTFDVVISGLVGIASANDIEHISTGNTIELVMLVDSIFLIDVEIELAVGYVFHADCHGVNFK